MGLIDVRIRCSKPSVKFALLTSESESDQDEWWNLIGEVDLSGTYSNKIYDTSKYISGIDML